MGDGTKEKPYTRKDVLRRIKANGGTAKGLDLSGKVFEQSIDLTRIYLGSVILQDTFLAEANFQGVLLPNANLRGAFLVGANFRGAGLWGADLEGAYLSHAELYDAMLDEIKWGPQYIMGEENAGDFIHAKEVYRLLKNCHQQVGMYDVAGEFFFREMAVKRKQFWWGDYKPRLEDFIPPLKLKELLRAISPRKPFSWAWSAFFSLICGYGERPLRVIGWAASVVLGLAFIYFIIGSVWEWSAFWNSLYFSAVSFTALGYGSSLNITNDWIRGLGAFESFIGVFSIALFLITFVRKMTR